VLYEEQAGLTDQMKELEVRIRDLDRQAEFGVLNVLTGALENVAELEKSGGVGSFDSFIPGVGGDQGFSPNGQGSSPNDQGFSPLEVEIDDLRNDQGSSPTAP
jgi:hypothetical protein